MTQDKNRPEVVMMPIGSVIPYDKNPRKNAKAVDAVAASIREFGFRSPIVVAEDMVVINGHTRLKAARKLGLKEGQALEAAASSWAKAATSERLAMSVT